MALIVDKVIPLDDPTRIGLHAGEKNEMVRRVVHQRTATTAIRPWKGPLPKVRLTALTLGDFVGSWKVVEGRRKKKRQTAAPAPAMDLGQIQADRESRLKYLLGQVGPDSREVVLGATELWGGRPRGETCPPSQVGRPHPQGFQP